MWENSNCGSEFAIRQDLTWLFFWFATDRWNNSIIGLGKGSPELFSPLYTHNRDSKDTKRQYLGRKCLLKSKALCCSLFSSKSGREDWCRMLLCFLLEGQYIHFWGSDLPHGYQSSLFQQRQAVRERTAKTLVRPGLSSAPPRRLKHALWKRAGCQPLGIARAKDNQKSYRKSFSHNHAAARCLYKA